MAFFYGQCAMNDHDARPWAQSASRQPVESIDLKPENWRPLGDTAIHSGRVFNEKNIKPLTNPFL